MLSDSVPAGPKISFPPCGPDMQSLQGCKKKVLKYQIIVRQKKFFSQKLSRVKHSYMFLLSASPRCLTTTREARVRLSNERLPVGIVT